MSIYVNIVFVTSLFYGIDSFYIWRQYVKLRWDVLQSRIALVAATSAEPAGKCLQSRSLFLFGDILSLPSSILLISLWYCLLFLRLFQKSYIIMLNPPIANAIGIITRRNITIHISLKAPLFYYNNELCSSNYSNIDSSIRSSVNLALFTAFQTEEKRCFRNWDWVTQKIRCLPQNDKFRTAYSLAWNSHDDTTQPLTYIPYDK